MHHGQKSKKWQKNHHFWEDFVSFRGVYLIYFLIFPEKPEGVLFWGGGGFILRQLVKTAGLWTQARSEPRTMHHLIVITCTVPKLPDSGEASSAGTSQCCGPSPPWSCHPGQPFPALRCSIFLFPARNVVADVACPVQAPGSTA